MSKQFVFPIYIFFFFAANRDCFVYFRDSLPES